MKYFNIWVDADSCPKIVREYVINCAKQYSLFAIFVTNRKFAISENLLHLENKSYKIIICDKLQNAADNYIAENVNKNDIVITRDIVFATSLAQKDYHVINDRGFLFTKDNAKQKLFDRNFDLQLTLIGLGGDKKATYNQKDFESFKESFKKEIQKLIVFATQQN